jgi:hypothetical protein
MSDRYPPRLVTAQDIGFLGTTNYIRHCDVKPIVISSACAEDGAGNEAILRNEIVGNWPNATGPPLALSYPTWGGLFFACVYASSTKGCPLPACLLYSASKFF